MLSFYNRSMIEILTPDEVAELLRLSTNRILLLARRGEIPHIVIDGRMRFDAAEVEDWVKVHRRNTLTRKPPRLVNESVGNE